MTTVGYGDITPYIDGPGELLNEQNDAEIVFSVVVMLIGHVAYAYLFGVITTYMTNLDTTAASFRMQVDRPTASSTTATSAATRRLGYTSTIRTSGTRRAASTSCRSSARSHRRSAPTF